MNLGTRWDMRSASCTFCLTHGKDFPVVCWTDSLGVSQSVWKFDEEKHLFPTVGNRATVPSSSSPQFSRYPLNCPRSYSFILIHPAKLLTAIPLGIAHNVPFLRGLILSHNPAFFLYLFHTYLSVVSEILSLLYEVRQDFMLLIMSEHRRWPNRFPFSGHIRHTCQRLPLLYEGEATLTTSYFYYTQIQRTAIKKLQDTLNKSVRVRTIGPLVQPGTGLKAFILSNILLKASLPLTLSVIF
jgi:hypothetical protein